MRRPYPFLENTIVVIHKTRPLTGSPSPEEMREIVQEVSAGKQQEVSCFEVAGRPLRVCLTGIAEDPVVPNVWWMSGQAGEGELVGIYFAPERPGQSFLAYEKDMEYERVLPSY